MKLYKTFCNTLLITTAIAFTGNVAAQSLENRGFEISKEAKLRDTGWGDSQPSTRMILKNKKGEEDIRNTVSKTLEVIDDGDKSLTIFQQPRDVKGTAFLSFSHALKPDDQWMYLPSLKRVKRISSRNKSGPFMGSEFSFEDLSSFELEKYTYNFVKEESCQLGNCFVVEQFPKDKTSGYTKRVVWIDSSEYRIGKIDFYDRKEQLLKTLEFNDYKKYLDKFWRAHHQVMTNYQTGKSTVLALSDLKFATGLSDKDFNKNALKRAR